MRCLFALIYLCLIAFSFFFLLYIKSLTMFLLCVIVGSIVVLNKKAKIFEGETPKWDLE